MSPAKAGQGINEVIGVIGSLTWRLKECAERVESFTEKERQLKTE